METFADLNFADSYFSNRAFADKWLATADDQKQKFLATATNMIEVLCTFFDDDDMPFVYAASEAPVWPKEAVCEQALYLLNIGKDPTQADKKTTLGIRTTDGTTFDKSFSADLLGIQCRVILERNGAEIDSAAIAGTPGNVSSGWVVK
jgi:hypothetical protein